MMEALFLPQQGLSDCVFPGTRSPELEPPRRRSAGARRNDEAEDCPARHMGGALKAFQVILHRWMYLGGKKDGGRWPSRGSCERHIPTQNPRRTPWKSSPIWMTRLHMSPHMLRWCTTGYERAMA